MAHLTIRCSAVKLTRVTSGHLRLVTVPLRRHVTANIAHDKKSRSNGYQNKYIFGAASIGLALLAGSHIYNGNNRFYVLA